MRRTHPGIVVFIMVMALIGGGFAAEFFGRVMNREEITVDTAIGGNGVRQIIKLSAKGKEFVTQSDYSNIDPVTDGAFIAWLGRIRSTWDVVFTHKFAQRTVQLSANRNASNVSIDNGRVAWESVDTVSHQVFLFDGVRVMQLTTGETSVNPSIEGNFVVYGKKTSDGDWYAELYNLTTNEKKIVGEGIGAKQPVLLGGKIFLTATGYNEKTGIVAEEALPSSINGGTNSVTEDDVRKELGAI